MAANKLLRQLEAFYTPSSLPLLLLFVWDPRLNSKGILRSRTTALANTLNAPVTVSPSSWHTSSSCSFVLSSKRILIDTNYNHYFFLLLYHHLLSITSIFLSFPYNFTSFSIIYLPFLYLPQTSP